MEDGFGALESPAGSGDIEPVGYEVSAGAFDDAGGDGPAVGEGCGVVEVGGFVGEVGGGFVGAFALGGGEFVGGCFASDRCCDDPGFAVEDVECFGSDPCLGGWVAFVVE